MQPVHGLNVAESVIARVRLGELGELAVGPIEFARIDNDAADAVAVPAEELRQRVNDNIRAKFKGAA